MSEESIQKEGKRKPAGERTETGIAGYFGVASIKFWLGLRDKRMSPINRTRNIIKNTIYLFIQIILRAPRAPLLFVVLVSSFSLPVPAVNELSYFVNGKNLEISNSKQKEEKDLPGTPKLSCDTVDFSFHLSSTSTHSLTTTMTTPFRLNNDSSTDYNNNTTPVDMTGMCLCMDMALFGICLSIFN